MVYGFCVIPNTVSQFAMCCSMHKGTASITLQNKKKWFDWCTERKGFIFAIYVELEPTTQIKYHWTLNGTAIVWIIHLYCFLRLIGQWKFWMNACVVYHNAWRQRGPLTNQTGHSDGHKFNVINSIPMDFALSIQ